MSTKKRKLDDYFEPVLKKRRIANVITKKWSCTACTFENNEKQIRCQICDTKRKIIKNISNVEEKKNEIIINSISCIKYSLQNNTTILWYKKYLDINFSNKLFNELLNIRYEQSTIPMWGKRVPIPRLQSWMSDKSKVLNKDANLYQKEECLQWSSSVLLLKNKLQELLNVQFDYVLINKYRNGKDYISYHSDGEAKDKHCNFIASISLGATRKFVLRHNEWKKYKLNKNKKMKYEFMLTSGALIVMKDDTQIYWKHAIMKTKKCNKPRINLTFRQLCK